MDIQQITNKIATMQRAIKTATTVVLKNKLKSKIAELKEDLRNANVPISKLAKSLLGSQRKVANYTKAEFKSAIKTLAKRDEYSFLKRYTIAEIEDDRERYAKPVGWRFKGRNNIKKPTAKELAIGKARGTVYYESRPNRSDVVRPVKLADGGNIDSTIEEYKNSVENKYYDWIKKTKGHDLQKIYMQDLSDHLFVIKKMQEGNWKFAYKTWANMDTASREEITNSAYELLMEKNNMPNYADGGSISDNNAIFDSLKKGDKVHITYDDSIAKNQSKNLIVKNRTRVGVGKKWESDKITFVNTSNPNGVKYFAYKRADTNRVSFAVGDMAIWMVKIEVENSMAKGGTTKQPKGFNIDLEVESRSGNKEHYHVGKMKGLGDAYISRTALEKNSPDNYTYKVTPTNKYAKGGDVMPFEKYEEIHDEIHENKFDKGGSVANAVDKHIATRNACLKHGATLDAYKMAHKQYAKGGRIGDSGVIQDPNSLYNGKMGTIVGEDGSFFLVKTTQGTGLVKKTRIKIVADNDFAKGGGLKKKDNGYDIKSIKKGDRIKDKYGYEAEVYFADGNTIKAEYQSGATYTYIQKDFDNGEVKFLWADRDIYEENEYAVGGNITHELDILWRRSGLTVYENIGIINALNDAGITMKDLQYNYVKGSKLNDKRKEQKVREIWAKAKPYYNGSLEGNQYYMTVLIIVEKANQGKNILQEWENNPSYQGDNSNVRYQTPPPKDDWRFAEGGKINTAYGDYVYTKLVNAENSFSTMTKPENYTLLVKKDKSKYLVTTNKRAKMFTDEYEIYGYGTSKGVYKAR